MSSPRSLQGYFILAGALVLALWLGMSLATNQSETLVKFAAALVLIVCVVLGRRVWLLMILFSALSIPLIRGLSTHDVGMMLFIGFSFLLFMMRRLPIKPRFGELEIWLLMLSLLVVQSYLRNPVGLNMFGAGMVGGRPYFLAALALGTGLILSVILVPAGELKWVPKLTVLGGLAGIPIGEYRTSRGLAALGAETQGGETARVSWLTSFGNELARWVISKLSPFQAIFRPHYLMVFLFCLLAAAASGYRNTVASVGLLFLFGIMYHHGVRAMLGSLVVAFITIGLLAGVNLVVPLPGTMQRALSPFPGTWEKRYVEAANNSTDWRVEMWEQALFTDHWIENKTFGDGLGLSSTELRRLQNISGGGRDNWIGTSGMTIQQENMMITGGYHSGPVHTVRTIGYVGLAILLLAMTRLSIHAHRQIVRCRNTEWFGVALFICLPIVILPIFWTFIFGEFHKGFAGVALGIGFVRLLDNNLPLPAWQKHPRERYLPMAGQESTGSNPMPA